MEGAPAVPAQHQPAALPEVVDGEWLHIPATDDPALNPYSEDGLGFDEGSLGDLVDVSNQGARGEFWEGKWGTADENEAILEGRAHYSVRELNKLHASRMRVSFEPVPIHVACT
jgi:hypothetical protein